jgi:NAD(P)H-nitrite reductase large subunit
MDHFNYVIVGGGIAGVTAAETIRQNDPNGTIAIISDEPYFLYSRVMLSKPNFFLGKIPFDQVWLKTEQWYKDNKINYLGGKTAIRFDSASKKINLSDNTSIGYDKLLLAVGVNVRTLHIPGSDKKGIHYLRTLDDGKAIMEHIKTAKKAVVIGGGFIGFEMADLLKLAGMDTTMLLREHHFWDPTLDEGSAGMIERAMTDGGIKILKNAEIAEILGAENIQEIKLKDGTTIECDMLMCGIGVVNNIEWISKSGVTTGKGILANEYLETNIPDVYTAGDIAEYKDLLLEENTQMGNWVNGREQGRIAGLNMTGKHEAFRFVSFYTTQGFGVTIAFVGDVAPGADRTIIARGSPELKSYMRILVAHNEIEGATMINRTGEMSTIAKLIEKNINVSDKLKELADPNFSLKSLL